MSLARRPSLPGRPHAAALSGLLAALLLSLAGCKGGDATPLTPAGAALVASAPAVSAARVPPPPALAASAAPAASADRASAQATLDATLAGAASCSADAECRSVAVGAKACGGPTGYRAYSTRTVSADRVEALAGQEREQAAQQARESHEVSPCFMLADPGARCVQNQCVTGRAAP